VIAPDIATAADWPAVSVRASNGNNSLKATVDLSISKWHLVIRGALLCQKGGHERIAFPARESTDRNDTRNFSNIIEFTDRETAGRFQGGDLATVDPIAGTSWPRSIP
jgi:hypothetical protein